VGRHQDDP